MLTIDNGAFVSGKIVRFITCGARYVSDPLLRRKFTFPLVVFVYAICEFQTVRFASRKSPEEVRPGSRAVDVALSFMAAITPPMIPPMISRAKAMRIAMNVRRRRPQHRDRFHMLVFSFSFVTGMGSCICRSTWLVPTIVSGETMCCEMAL